MANRRIVCICLVLSLFVGCLSAQVVIDRASGQYNARVLIEDGRPVFAITNNGNSSITGLAITVDLSNGANLAEERIYYDSAMNSVHNPPIVPGHTERIPLGFIVGSDVTKLSPELHAVLYFDGTTLGEPPWISVALGRRQRLVQRLAAIQALLGSHLNPLSHADPISDLTTVKAQALSSDADDDMRVVDEVAFDSAISTLKAAKIRDGDRNIGGYSQRLLEKMRGLESSTTPFFNRGIQPSQVSPKPRTGGRWMADQRSPQGPHIEPASLLLRERAAPQIHRGPRLIFADLYTCSEAPSTPFTPSPNDESTVILTLDDCGPSQKWELEASIQDFDQTTGAFLPDVVFDAGLADAFGECWVGYTDCGGNSKPGGADAGIVHLQNHDNGTQTELFWELDDWSSPTTSPCSECDPDPGGVNFNAPVENTTPSGSFFFNDETTAPGCVVFQ